MVEMLQTFENVMVLAYFMVIDSLQFLVGLVRQVFMILVAVTIILTGVVVMAAAAAIITQMTKVVLQVVKILNQRQVALFRLVNILGVNTSKLNTLIPICLQDSQTVQKVLVMQKHFQ